MQKFVTPPSFCKGEGWWTSYQIFKKGEGLVTTLIFREGLVRKRGVTFLRGVSNFYVKDKLKSEIFNDKNSLYQN